MRISIGLGLASILQNGGGPAAPTISAIANARGNAVGDTDGGYTVTLTGTGFSGGGLASATIGGNAVTSLSVTNDTTATCTVPAGTIGQKDVVVTGPGGSNTLTNGWRNWDPSALTLTGWWRETRVTSGTDVTQWTDKSGNARHWPAAANYPQVGSAINGQPSIDFDGGAQQFVSAIDLATLLPNAASTFISVWEHDAVNAGTVLIDASSWAIYSSSGGTTATRATTRIWDSAYRTATEVGHVLTAATKYIIEHRHDGTSAYARVNGDTANQASAACGTRGGSSAAKFGASCNGRCVEALCYGSDMSLTNRDYFVDYALTRYNITL
jgi:hypothetical protein